ncbi:hypothetical protein ACFX2I_000458 [Malus domestica]
MVTIYLIESLEIRPVFNCNTVIDPFLNEKILPKLPGGKCMLIFRQFTISIYLCNRVSSFNLISVFFCYIKRKLLKTHVSHIFSYKAYRHDKKVVTLTWGGDNCSTVEISGLDIGWDQMFPLEFNEEQGSWFLERKLPEGRYEYKYIIDG